MSKTTHSTVISKIPSASVLTSPTPPIPCTVKDCGQILKNTGTLYLHMLKHHNIDTRNSKSTKDGIRYFCPELKCKYNESMKRNARSFASKKYLKQHCMKVHAKKSFPCSKGFGKTFSSLTFKVAHEVNNCGQEFICIQCGWVYKSKEALMTHCRRKNHLYPKPVETNLTKVEKEYVIPSIPNKWLKIAPKLNSKSKDKTIGISVYVRKKSQSTQTLPADNHRDKTFLDDWNKLVTQPSRTRDDKLCLDKPKTKVIKSDQTTTTTNRSFRNLDIFDTESSTLMTNSSYAQTDKNLNNLNYVEDDSLLFGSENFHAGTQTEYELFQQNIVESTNSDQLDQILYSNMHTQTCDEILSELGLANIQTQTNWTASDYNDLLVSTVSFDIFLRKLFFNTNTNDFIGQLIENFYEISSMK